MSVSHSHSIHDKRDSLTLWMSSCDHAHICFGALWPDPTVTFKELFCWSFLCNLSEMHWVPCNSLQDTELPWSFLQKKFSWRVGNHINILCHTHRLEWCLYLYWFLQAWNYFPKIAEGYQLLQTPAHLFCRDMQGNGTSLNPEAGLTR